MRTTARACCRSWPRRAKQGARIRCSKEVSAGGVVSRIRDVEALVLYGKFPYVVVQTEDGLTGIGECDVFSAKAVKPAVDLVLKPLLIGKNALDTGPLWDQMSEAMQRASMF